MRFFVLAFLTLVGLSAIGIRVVSERNDQVALGFDIAAQNREAVALENQRRQLLIDRASLLDPKRLAPIGSKNGLHMATPSEIVPVPLEAKNGP